MTEKPIHYSQLDLLKRQGDSVVIFEDTLSRAAIRHYTDKKKFFVKIQRIAVVTTTSEGSTCRNAFEVIRKESECKHLREFVKNTKHYTLEFCPTCKKYFEIKR